MPGNTGTRAITTGATAGAGAGDDAGPPGAPTLLPREDAELLGSRIQAHAAHIAESTCELLLLVAAFERGEALRWFTGMKSVAHWLSWACSMSLATAREHVRVSRALAHLPATVEEFRAGRLSYSKVREMSRVVGLVDESTLLDLARAMTASQLARTVAGFRAAAGTRLGQEVVREASWRVREDGMVEIRAVLPPETGAEVVTALDLALDRDGTVPVAGDGIDRDPVLDPGATGDEGATVGDGAARGAVCTEPPPLVHRKVDALVELARAYLDAAPVDRSGDDRHLVLVHVTADALAAAHVELAVSSGEAAPRTRAVASGRARRTRRRHLDPRARSVPAGTPRAPAVGSAGGVGRKRWSRPSSRPPRPVLDGPQRAGIAGLGPVEAATAERLTCTGRVALVVTDAQGEVLHLGRSRRLASRAQRRALGVRDGRCVFPGCEQTRHLDAHHLVPWAEGGDTDLENLALLCRRHHVMVHEGGLRLARRLAGPTGASRFAVLDVDGVPVEARWPDGLETIVTVPVDTDADLDAAADLDADLDLDPVPGTERGPAADRIFPATGGYGFSLRDCVGVLCEASVLTRTRSPMPQG